MADFQKDWLDRSSEMRCPWQDIGSSVVGLAASDAGRHFIERWNSHMYYCFKSAVKLSTPGLRRFRIPAIAEARFQKKWSFLISSGMIFENLKRLWQNRLLFHGSLLQLLKNKIK